MDIMKNQGAYTPQEFEDKIYKVWEEKGYFKATTNSGKKPFTIVMPPPNVTSKAHIGHGLNMTLQDILIRYKRMQGFEALWLPGSDHAALATEHKLVEKLANEGKTKEGIGREAFDKEAWDWYNFYGDAIMNQFKKMGFSADWDRYRFTMDEKSTNAVLEAFIRLYNKGYIYRGSRETNWCIHCKSVVSDDEVVYSDEKGSMWHIHYEFADGTGHITVATTRPETLFGDTAVAVNPDDERYKNIVGKKVIIPVVGREIPIIADSYVEKEFGTGMVKITPAHDPNDYEVGKRHNLEVLQAISKSGVMTDIAGEKYEGLGLLEAREKLVAELKEIGALEKVEPYSHSVGHCERCKTAIEPMITEQWFVKMSELVKPAIKCVEDGSLKIYPKRFEKNYFHWLRNIRDWCISRQIWTGHRIPIYYCADCKHVMASKTNVEVCEKCGSKNVNQDPDVLDTWFSSALWPITTLGWPEKTPDLEYFYPTSVLVTGFDILTQWVTKMVYMGIEGNNNIPFENCLIHGLVRDSQGRKMSKSLGNGIDPLEIVKDYGADTLRVALVKDMAMGMDTRFSQNKIDDARTFINKVWNASKFISMHQEGVEMLDVDSFEKDGVQKWILFKLNEISETVTKNLDKFDVGVALSNIVSFTLDVFCDWAIELSKPAIFEGGERKQKMVSVLAFAFSEILKLLHPFIPYATAYIYERMEFVGKAEDIMISSYAKTSAFKKFKADAEKTGELVDLITNLRKFKLDAGKKSSDKVEFVTKESEFAITNKAVTEKMANIVLNFGEADGKTLVTSVGEWTLVEEKVDAETQKAILKKDIEKVTFEIERSKKMLGNPNFMAKAPETLVSAEREKLAKNEELFASLNDKLNSL
ncbi:MAG: valine--tRNA ligase [Clostridia bacterium]|nr:valine--tRNA ligase [Clostridia bacterium]